MTKDEIFAAMEKAYTGAGSTVEGSFAGDLLRACADGCAELWSTEIDGLEERAFVASAAGEWLTRVCADRGGGRGGAERRGRKAPHRRGRKGVRGGRKAAEHRRKRCSERGREPRRGRKRI